MTNGKHVSVPPSVTPTPKLISNLITTYTYIPVKNCNIVQTEADAAIMSLNPSIENNPVTDFCISRQQNTDDTRKHGS
jgi:hypothetical protein